jgi:hypothetical protein
VRGHFVSGDVLLAVIPCGGIFYTGDVFGICFNRDAFRGYIGQMSCLLSIDCYYIFRLINHKS